MKKTFTVFALAVLLFGVMDVSMLPFASASELRGGASLRIETSAPASCSSSCSLELDADTGDASLEPAYTGVCCEEINSALNPTPESTVVASRILASERIVIQGHLQYNNATGYPFPMRDILVELWDEDTYTADDRVQTTYTTDTGFFCFSVANDHGDDGGGYDLYVKWWARNHYAWVQSGMISGDYYANLPKCGNDVPDDFYYDYGYWGPVGYYNNITLALDAVLTEHDWIYENTDPHWERSESARIRYPYEEKPHHHEGDIDLPWHSSHYWDFASVCHEYAHSVMYALYGEMPEGDGPDPHSLGDESSPGFAMKEGWAEFMESVILAYPLKVEPRISIEWDDWYNVQDRDGMDGVSVEGSVAAILWDILDPINPTGPEDDYLQRSFNDIFKCMRSKPQDIDQFWNAWKQYFPDVQTSVGPLCLIYWTAGIDKDSALRLRPDAGSIIINNDTRWAVEPDGQVTISIDPSWGGGSGIQYVRFRNEDGTYGDWLYYTRPFFWESENPLDWWLSEGDGPKRVYAQFMDKCGHISSVEFSDYIVLDSTPPTGSMTIDWMGDTAIAKRRDVTLRVDCRDYTSGVSEVRFRDEWGAWSDWEPYSVPFTKPWTLQGNRGPIRVYCQVKDRAGNMFEFNGETYFSDAKLTHVFFNLNPNPAVEHGNIELKGIVVDEEGNPVPPSPSGGPPYPSFGRVVLFYRRLDSNDLTWQSKSLSVSEDGTFGTSIDESWGLYLSGEICFRARYIAGLNYVDSEAEACLRCITSEVQSPESSLYFNINPSHVLHDGQAVLTGILLDNTGLPIHGDVTISLSIDDGANWESEETVSTDELGIFYRAFLFWRKGADKFDVGTCVLVQVSYGQYKPFGKTAYMRITDQIGEVVLPTVLAYEWSPLNLIRTISPREVYLELPVGYDVNFVDATSLRINNTIAVTPECLAFRDVNSDGTLDLTLTLNPSAISQFLLSRNMTTGNVTLFLTGRFYDNTIFGQTMLIKIRMPGDINIDGKVDIKDVAVAGKAFGSYEGHPRWNPTADENEDGKIDIRDIVLICKKFGTKYT